MPDAAGFEGAAELLPCGLRERFMTLGGADRSRAEELRLRIGRAPCVLLPEGEREIGGGTVTRRDMDGVLDIVTRVSAHSVQGSLAQGFVTARGGYRVGFCGTALVSDGVMTGYRSVSSAAVRIPREARGAADGVLERIMPDGKLRSTLIISPPGAGKTTLLRDMVRQLSDGGARVALADERGEVAALCSGEAQLDVGRHTDVLDACPKASAVLLLLRAMNPEIIAFDEITAPEDIEAAACAANCGVRLIATAHADDVRDLKARPMYRKLLRLGIFERTVVISRGGNGDRTYICGEPEV